MTKFTKRPMCMKFLGSCEHFTPFGSVCMKEGKCEYQRDRLSREEIEDLMK